MIKNNTRMWALCFFFGGARPYLIVFQQLKTLEASVESLRSSVPKSRFTFKRKLQVPPEFQQTPTSSDSATSSSKDTEVPPTSSFSVTLSSQTDKYLTHESFSNYSEPTNLVISDLDTCVVDLLSPGTTSRDLPKISALHGRNLRNCVLLLPFIEGSALFHDLVHCTIILACHQVGHDFVNHSQSC